jgi:hypothetical protein
MLIKNVLDEPRMLFFYWHFSPLVLSFGQVIKANMRRCPAVQMAAKGLQA